MKCINEDELKGEATQMECISVYICVSASA